MNLFQHVSQQKEKRNTEMSIDLNRQSGYVNPPPGPEAPEGEAPLKSRANEWVALLA